ncbi:MAG: hypothetical protein GX781_05350, partial [Clostridiales bacterium]|nr:hypothetical protein [Clostridiales bacterium]
MKRSRFLAITFCCFVLFLSISASSLSQGIILDEHIYESDDKIIFSSNCAEHEKEESGCEIGGDAHHNGIQSLEHTWSGWIIKTHPTCAYSGKQYAKCLECGIIKEEDIPPNNMHQYGKDVLTKLATCQSPGEITYTCKICKAQLVEQKDKLKHEFGSWESVGNTPCN